MSHIELIREPDPGEIALQNRGWEAVGRFLLACTELYQQDSNDTNFQSRFGPGLANVLSKAFPEFGGRLKITFEPGEIEPQAQK